MKKEIYIKEMHGHYRTSIKKIGPQLWEFSGNEITKQVPESERSKYEMIIGTMESGELIVNLGKEDNWLKSMTLKVDNSTLDGPGLLSYIKVFELLMNEKVNWVNSGQKTGDYSNRIKWKKNPSNIQLLSDYVGGFYNIQFTVLNSLRVNYEGDDFWKDYALHDSGSYDQNRYPNKNNQGGATMHVLEEDLKQYIEDLIEEYERETGEKYERLEEKHPKSGILGKIFGKSR